MKTLLINPATPMYIDNKDYYIPSSLLYLATVLKNAGEDVKVIDLNTAKIEHSNTEQGIFEEIINEYIRDYRPSLVGITCLFCGQFPAVLKFSNKIKEQFEEIKIVIGGIHPTTYPFEILLNCASIDFIVQGEGEMALLQLVSAIQISGSDLSKIDGLAYRDNDKIVVNPKISFIDDLDDMPFPNYDLINLSDYYHNTLHWHNPKGIAIDTSIPIISSRSCPNRCSFCSMFMVMGLKWRCRSSNNVVNEIEYLYNKYNHRHFSFMDDNISLNKIRIIDICNQIVQRNMDIQFEIPNGLSIKTLDRDILDALVSAGMIRVALAIESGSDYIRNEIMGKRLSREKISEIVQLTKEYPELYVRAFFIMGMPEDTKETLMETYHLINEIDVDMPQVYNLLPFPGTKVFQQAIDDKLFIDDVDLRSLWNMDKFYGSGNKKFFIIPYRMELNDLCEFRDKVDRLIDELMVNKIRVGNLK